MKFEIGDRISISYTGCMMTTAEDIAKRMNLVRFDHGWGYEHGEEDQDQMAEDGKLTGIIIGIEDDDDDQVLGVRLDHCHRDIIFENNYDEHVCVKIGVQLIVDEGLFDI